MRSFLVGRASRSRSFDGFRGSREGVVNVGLIVSEPKSDCTAIGMFLLVGRMDRGLIAVKGVIWVLT